MYVKEAFENEGKSVKLRGWAYRVRKGKELIFIILRDRTGIIQCAVKSDSKHFKLADSIEVETSLEVEGVIQKEPRAVNGYEMKTSAMSIIGESHKFPIARDKSTEHLMNYRHLWLRSREMNQMLKVRDEMFRASREYFRKRGFFETTCPMFVGTRGEGGSDLFELDYFGQKAYLTQTSQMHLEAQFYSLGNVFTIAPSFRAEKSRTRKHLTEFWHLEIEEETDLKGLMKTMEELISHLAASILKNRKEELINVGGDPKMLAKIKPPFNRMTYTKVVEKLNEFGSKMKWGEDISTEDELLLTKDLKKPLMITHWPKEIKTFYMPIDPKDERVVLNVDMQAPKGYAELFGGSQRSTDYNEIIKRLKSEGDDPKKYEWYLDLMKYGAMPHSGFGMGIDRTLMWLTNAEHIRDCIPFPRFVNRVSP